MIECDSASQAKPIQAVAVRTYNISMFTIFHNEMTHCYVIERLKGKRINYTLKQQIANKKWTNLFFFPESMEPYLEYFAS